MRREKNIAILALMLILILLLAGTTMTVSKYTSKAEGQAIAVAAAFVFTDAKADGAFYAEDLPTAPGSSVDYIFTVKNFDGTKRCEVALDYGIEIVTHNNLPLTFELSSVPPSSLNHALTPVTPVPGAVAGSPTVKNRYSGGHLGVDSNYTHTYKLKISWPVGEKDKKYMDEIDLVQIKVKAEQTKPT